MGKIIRRTITITMTESWTIVWLPDDEPKSQASTIQPKTEEAADETLQATISDTEPGKPGTSDPTARRTRLANEIDGQRLHRPQAAQAA